MKKLLNISVIAALAILPLAANADPMTAVTINTPQDNQTVATTGYVKGAYNALVAGKQDKLSADQLQAIEAVTDLNTDVSALKTAVGDASSGLTKAVADNTSDISALETAVGDSTSGLVKDVANLKTTVGDSTSGLVKDVADLKTAGYATTTGVAATVNAATASKTGVSLGVSVTSAGSVESSFTGDNINIPTSAAVPTLTTWGNDNSNSTAPVTLTTTATSVTGTVASTFTGSTATGTATGDITDIDVAVPGYQAN